LSEKSGKFFVSKVVTLSFVWIAKVKCHTPMCCDVEFLPADDLTETKHYTALTQILHRIMNNSALH